MENAKREIYSAAVRGRYHDGKIKQHIELRSNEYINTLTTVQKDNVIVEFRRNVDIEETNSENSL